MKFLAFDVEAYTPDFQGISCVVTCESFVDLYEGRITVKDPELVHREDYGRMTEQDIISFTNFLEEKFMLGYTIVTFNGTGYDFRVLYEESKDDRLKRLALRHYDIMSHVIYLSGYACKLSHVADGMRCKVGKIKEVELKNGSKIEIDGSIFPTLWAHKEYEAALKYVLADGKITAEIAARIYTSKILRYKNTWTFTYKGVNLPTSLDCVKTRKENFRFAFENFNYGWLYDNL